MASNALIRRTAIIVLPGLALLLVPWAAMQFTDEVRWGVFDFIVAGALLIAAGFLFQFMAPRAYSRSHRILIGAAIVVAVLAIWSYLAHWH